MTEPITSLPAAVAAQGALPMPAGRTDISRLDVPTDVLEQRVAAAHFEQAAARTSSPSEQIAYRLDAWLVTHPDVCATAEQYPDWPAQFAAIKKAHSSKEAL
ncbi:hypothetical protein [Streptomyces sp. NPDC057052]|uniref:hypothetical protein n=1 Tax=Streptomyces sp. NPDC057052 TaxID=3346010 RepID=UPI0036448C65